MPAFEDNPLTEYMTEQEQVELIKQWVKQYLPVIIAGLVIAGVGMFAWRSWQEKQAAIRIQASTNYDVMINERAAGDTAKTVATATTLYRNYTKTPYSQMAALMLAREAAAKKEFPVAEKYLRWVMENSKSTGVREIARIRLARILISDGKPQAAIDLLNTLDDKTFTGLSDEVKGDAYLILNKPNDAYSAYGNALSATPNADTMRPILRMKYDNLTPNSHA